MFPAAWAQRIRAGSLSSRSPVKQSLTEPVAYDSGEFAALFIDATKAEARARMGERIMNLNRIQRSAWLSALVHWLGSHGPKSLRPVAAALLKAIPESASGRVAAVRLTLSAAQFHPEFRKHQISANDFQAKQLFSEAEHSYWQALRIFPLHAASLVQYSHMLKDQQKYLSAVVNYCFALSVGAPLHDVMEHLLFAANRAQLAVSASDVERLASAWSNLAQSENDWDAPPVYQDFFDLSLLFWGNAGLLTNEFMQPYLLKCPTRKLLFIALLGSPETLRHNRQFFVMMNEKEAASV